MGGFNPVLSGLGRGAALAQLIRQQAIDDAREKRAAEDFQRQKAIEEATFIEKARELGGRATTGADAFQRSSGKMLTPKGRVEIDPTTGRRTVIPGFGVAESDIKSRIIKSPGGQEFVLPTKAEMEAEQARKAREAFQAEVLKKQVFGQIDAETEGKKTGAKKRAELPFDVAADVRKGQLAAAEDVRQSQIDRAKDMREAEQKRLDREKDIALAGIRESGANKRNAATNAMRKYVADTTNMAKHSGANVDAEEKQLNEISFEIERLSEAATTGKSIDKDGEEIDLSQAQRKLMTSRLNEKLQEWKRITGVIERKRKLAEGAGGRQGGAALPPEGTSGKRPGKNPASGGVNNAAVEQYLRSF